MSIIVDNISYIYEKGTGFERQALKNVSCAIEDGEFIGLIGHTGSGKSTFIQHLNGLVKPTEGHIYYNGKDRQWGRDKTHKYIFFVARNPSTIYRVSAFVYSGSSFYSSIY